MLRLRSISLFLALVLALALLMTLVGAAPRRAAAQEPGEAARSFSWAASTRDLGTVSVPAVSASVAPGAGTGGAAGTTGGWHQGPLGLHYRSIPSFTGDPTFEVVIGAPYSGNPILAERLVIQIPRGYYAQPWSKRALVFGFHSFGVSEKDVFLNSTLAWKCSERKWLLVAPYGLTDTNYANPRSQASLEAIGHILYSLIPFNYRRVYGVGFSMGGLSALSYAMRHMDPWQLQFAGVVVHTAPLDMRREVVAKPYIAQLLLSDWDHFGADFASSPFEYERVSPVRFLQSGQVDDGGAPVVNLTNRPIYLHANLADPDPLLVAGMTELGSFLGARGAIVREDLAHDPAAGHSWMTLRVGQALDFVGQYSLPAAEPPLVEVFADAPKRWPHVEILAQSQDAFAHYQLELSPAAASTTNSLALSATRELDRLLFDVERLGLDVGQPLEVRHATADSSPDTLVFGGYTSSPTSVTVNGGEPYGWSWQPTLKELSIRPTADGGAAVIVITP